MKIKVISFDIFQTLVDVNKRIPQIWRGILGDDYSEEKAKDGAIAVLGCLQEVFHDSINAEPFLTMQEVYDECARRSIQKTGLKVSCDSIVYHLLYQHSQAPVYEDVLPCMKKLHENYKIVLSSDSSHFMIDELLKQFIYDDLFISDDLCSYKGNRNGKFFKHVIEKLNVQPGEILHIGDSYSDVYGASIAGIKSCWLNRDSLPWKHEIIPDYTVKSLSEVEKICHTM